MTSGIGDIAAGPGYEPDPADMELVYRALSLWEIDDALVADLNILLRQLSTKDVVITSDSLSKLLGQGTIIFAAIDGERVVATVLLGMVTNFTGRKAWIEDVVTDDAYRGRGIAKELLAMAEEAAIQAGATTMNLTSNPTRVAARAMYGSQGYAVRDTGVFCKVL